MTTVWNIDGSHSHATFTVRHLMISNVKGEFRTLAGKVTFSPDAPEQAVVEAEVEVASIHTREEKRDEHLRSADFFDAEKFPKITFRSTRIERDGDDLKLTGDLTIRGTTKPVTFQVEALSPIQTDPWGGKRIGTSATAKIKRSEFGVTWNAALETGGVVVGDEIKIALDIELVKSAS